MAEIEFSVLKRQCLSRRIPDQQTLKREVQAWQKTGESAMLHCPLAVYYPRCAHQTQEIISFK